MLDRTVNILVSLRERPHTGLDRETTHRAWHRDHTPGRSSGSMCSVELYGPPLEVASFPFDIVNIAAPRQSQRFTAAIIPHSDADLVWDPNRPPHNTLLQLTVSLIDGRPRGSVFDTVYFLFLFLLPFICLDNNHSLFRSSLRHLGDQTDYELFNNHEGKIWELTGWIGID